MKNTIRYILPLFLAMFSAWSCQKGGADMQSAGYVMFADTLKTYPVRQDVEYFSVPVVSNVICDYDRTFGVEIIDKGSNAIERYHYRLESNTLTIKAGENRTDVRVHGIYDNIEAQDSLGFELALVIPDALEMPLYGKNTKVVMMKSCPFNINEFTGYCILTSLFLYKYPALTSANGAYQRVITTASHDTERNTIVCKDLFLDGYDVNMTFEADDPMSPKVSVAEDQVIGDEVSFFGQTHGDNRIRVRTSNKHKRESIFYPCGRYLTVWLEMYVEDNGVPVGTVGHFYNIMEWITKEEADRLHREEGI